MRETREGNRPPRRVYRLTAKGEAQYQKLLRENLGSFIAAKFPGDVGLAYADDLDPQEVLTLLAERRTALLAQLEADAASAAACRFAAAAGRSSSGASGSGVGVAGSGHRQIQEESKAGLTALRHFW